MGYVQIFWCKSLGKQHCNESHKANSTTIKIYFQRKSLCNIHYVSLTGSQLSYKLKEETGNMCSFFPTLPML